MSGLTKNQRLLNRLRSDFDLKLTNLATIRRTHAGLNQRRADAWSWFVWDPGNVSMSNVGSHETVTALVQAKCLVLDRTTDELTVSIGVIVESPLDRHFAKTKRCSLEVMGWVLDGDPICGGVYRLPNGSWWPVNQAATGWNPSMRRSDCSALIVRAGELGLKWYDHVIGYSLLDPDNFFQAPPELVVDAILHAFDLAASTSAE